MVEQVRAIYGLREISQTLTLYSEVLGNGTQTKKTLSCRTIADLALECDRKARKWCKSNLYVAYAFDRATHS